MRAQIEANLPELERLCRRFRVRRLEVFGSAATDEFDASRSDLDFLVEFEDMPPKEYAASYFGLWEALQQLFDRSVDLVTSDSVRNPYFRQSVDATRRLLYAA